MPAPLQNLFSIASWGGGTDEYGNPSYTQTGITPQDVQAMQQIAPGALTPTARDSQGNVSGGQGFNVNYGVLPKTSVGTSVQGWSPWAPASQLDASKLHNPKALINDPNYGWITPTANIKTDTDLLSRIGNIAPYAIMAGLSAGMPAAIGAVGGAEAGLGAGSQIFNAAGNLIEGNKFNPLATLGGLAGGFVPGFGTAMSGLGLVRALQSGNPLAALMTLGRMAKGFGNG